MFSVSMSENGVDLFKIFAEDKRMILYRPGWRKFTGSVTATILLQQILFHWEHNRRQPFFKFKEPCDHRLYKDGDSWTEELGFSRKEFDNAIKKIGYKKSAKNSQNHKCPVEYWIDPSRLTFYTIQTANLFKLLSKLYQAKPEQEDQQPEEQPEQPIEASQESQERADSAVKSQRDDTKSPKGTLPDPQRGDTKSAKGDFPTKSQRDVTKSAKGDFPLDQRSSSEIETTTEREEHPALAFFVENFPDVELNDQKKADIRNTITNLEAWKYTIWWWKFKEYRSERTDNMLNFYQTKAIPKLQHVTENYQEQTGKEQSNAPVPDTGTGDDNGDIRKLWAAALQTLETRINRPSFNTWLKPIALSALSDHAVQISVPEEVFVYWLEEYYQDVIVEVLAEKLGFRPTISFVVVSEEPKQAELWG